MLLDTSSPPDGPRDCGPFFLDVVGAYQPAQVVVHWTDRKRARAQQVEELIERTWQSPQHQEARADGSLYDGRLCRLLAYREADGRLELTVGEVSFREFLGTNLTNAHLRYLHGCDVLGDALGVSAAVVTSDGFLLFGRRSRKVTHYQERIHPVGGVVEPPAGQDGRPPDLFASVVAEIGQELNVPPSVVSDRDRVLLGLVRDKRIVQPELVFDVKLNMDALCVREAARTAPDAQEHDEIIPVRDHPSAVVSYIDAHSAELTPVALATLLLHGLRHWGSGWFAATRGYLRGVI